MENTQNDTLFDLEFDQIIKSHMESTAKWARVIAYIAFTSYAVSFIVAIFGKGPTGFRSASLAGAIIGAIIGGILHYFLLKFANHTLAAIAGNSELDMEKATENLNYYNKMMGILLIIGLSFFVIFTLFVLMFNK